MGKAHIRVISLVIAGAVSFLIYKVNVKTYIDYNRSTRWLPDPGGKLAFSTVVFHVWCAIVGSTISAYVIYHIAVSIKVYRVLCDWTEKGIENMTVTALLKDLDSMIQYFTSFIYPLLPAVLLCCVSIVKREINLNDPVVVLTVVGLTVLLFLVYLIALTSTGLESTIVSAKRLIDDKRVERLSIFPSHTSFYWWIFSPIWSMIVTMIIKIFISGTNNPF
jgi:hypothetical protein